MPEKDLETKAVKNLADYKKEIVKVESLRDLNAYAKSINGEIAALPKADGSKVLALINKRSGELPHIERVKTSEFLRTELTDVELSDISQEMAQAQISLETAEADKKTAASQFDSDIKKAKSSLSHNARLFRDGYEMRNQECEKVKDYSTRRVAIVRIDTQQIVRERPMTVDEMQMSLPVDLM